MKDKILYAGVAIVLVTLFACVIIYSSPETGRAQINLDLITFAV